MSEATAITDWTPRRQAEAARSLGLTMFPLTPTSKPCGVEVFTRKLVAALKTSGRTEDYELLPVSGRWRDLSALLRNVMRADRIVFGFPLVAWKRMLVTPLLLLLLAATTRRDIVVVLHEWRALHWLRRLALWPFVVLSDTIIVLSPYIRDEIARDPWVRHAGKKCRMVPHPPTIRRPDARKVTERVRKLERDAQDHDIVIGSFGSIYKGKAPDALLDICAHLRANGRRPLVVFVGDFIASLDNYEARFRARANELGVADSIVVTGYVESEEELYALFERIGVFLFLFPEGMTARRSSVIACLQSNRPVVVSAPRSLDEFSHHEGLRAVIAAGSLLFVPRSAGVPEIADRLIAATERKIDSPAPIDADAWWDAAIKATRAAFRQKRGWSITST